MNDEGEEEFQLVAMLFRAMKEYVAWSLVMDGVITQENTSGKKIDEIAWAKIDEIIAPVCGNKAHSNLPFTNQDAHLILDAVARWRLENPSGNFRP